MQFSNDYSPSKDKKHGHRRMFPDLRPLRTEPEKLEALGNAMFDGESEDNEAIPSGYTYFGLFIDHDITLGQPTSFDENIVKTLAYRTPKFNLNCIYGEGPSVQRYLYQRSPQNQHKLLIGSTRPTNTMGGDLDSFDNDLPRSPEGFALIGNPHNDQTLVVAQLHLAFLKFHNKVAEELEKGTINSEYEYSSGNKFEIARKIVTWHYQWILLHDFLPTIIDNNQLNKVLVEGPSFYPYTEETFIPIEFSMAAFRYGHSIVRPVYKYNRKFPIASLKQLFAFTGSFSSETVPIRSNWIIDWRMFFPIDESIQPNFSRKLDPFLAKPLEKITTTFAEQNLAIRDLKRGHMAGLPSGQNIAKFMGLQPLQPDDIASGNDGKIAKENNFHIESPLWYYILKEAQIQQDGKSLGEVGSRILAEVFIGLLMADNDSFMVQDKNWKPMLPAKIPATFTMVDLLKFVNDINPIGD